MLINEIEATLKINPQRSILEPLNLTECEEAGIELYVKRDDLIHPIISGNKWRKLKYIIEHALNTNHQHLISMGGPYSNHLHALAYVAKQLGLKSTAYIRGEEISTQTLTEISSWGMKLIFIDRESFRELRNFKYHNDKPAQKHSGYWIPEGGSNLLALRGVHELLNEIKTDFNIIVLACGTGTTLKGIVKQLTKDQYALGFSSFKGKDFLSEEIKAIEGINENIWSIKSDYHFGGFGKHTNELVSFMNEFEIKTGIPLEHVYTGKMFYGLLNLIQEHYFPEGTKIIALHTGGLQGKLNPGI